MAASHPGWCRCPRCEAADLAHERMALAGELDPIVEAELAPVGHVGRDLTDKSQRHEADRERYEPGYSFEEGERT